MNIHGSVVFASRFVCARASRSLAAWLLGTLLCLSKAFAVAGPPTNASNLFETVTGTSVVNSSMWWSTGFTTDNSAAGWTLTSVTLSMVGSVSNTGNLVISLYSNNASKPGTSLGTLSGSYPTSSGQFTFTTAGISLAPNTTYHLVTGVSAPGNTYNWNYVGTNQTGWSIADTSYGSDNQGSAWFYSTSPNAFSVTATASAVPEPSTCATILGAAALGAFAARNRRRRATAELPGR